MMAPLFTWPGFWTQPRKTPYHRVMGLAVIVQNYLIEGPAARLPSNVLLYHLLGWRSRLNREADLSLHLDQIKGDLRQTGDRLCGFGYPHHHIFTLSTIEHCRLGPEK